MIIYIHKQDMDVMVVKRGYRAVCLVMLMRDVGRGVFAFGRLGFLFVV